VNHAALRFNKILDRLDALFLEASETQDMRNKELLLSYMIIKLHDQWNYRSRQIVLKSFGHSEGRMMEYLRNNWGIRPRDNSWEPDWHIPNNTIRAATLLNIPDLAQVQDALGAVIYIDDIRWTRNAIVHNIPASFAKYRNMTLSKYHLLNAMPFLLPMERNPITGNSIYEDWCDDLKNALRYAL
jgi:hypothetical protein